jgi:glycosyltransferase involved in cell wall biosynthesis
LPNVHFLGPRPYDILPQYLRGFDVATVPFVVNDVTLRASPIKFYEYLASGVPIVATRLPDFETLSDFAYLVEDADEFTLALQRTVSEDTPEFRQRRMAEAKHHSWTSRFKQIDVLIEQALQNLRKEASEL